MQIIMVSNSNEKLMLIMVSKLRRLLRNVCVALGNVGTAEDLPALDKARVDSEPLVAEHAQWAIDRINQRAFAGNC